MVSRSARPSRLTLIINYLIIYFVWGSTYLAIRFTVATIPPLMSGAMRFLTAGLVMVTVRSLFAGVRTSARGWRNAFLASLLPLSVSYGLITCSERYVPSSIAALLAALEPMWLCILGWLFFHEERPSKIQTAGIVIGFAGVLLLVAGSPGADFSFRSDYIIWLFALMLSNISFAAGALLTKDLRANTDQFMSSGMQMVCGGATMLAMQFCLSAATGSWPSLANVSASSWTAMLYLIVIGSLVAYTSFLWLMKNEPPARISTYAFVNPIIAFILGWLLGGEAIFPAMFAATPLILISVVMLLKGRR